MRILVTGGAGYIGSHACMELLNADHEVIVVDNFSNSNSESLERVKRITGKEITLYDVDILNKEELERIFKKHQIDAVIHFAGLKAVGESVQKPILYYQNNVSGSLVLFDVMQRFNVKKIVFSSSATVYGNPKTVPIEEHFSLSATNPYGNSKLMVEDILRDTYKSDKDWSIVLLRYFNPIGAHESGMIGEDPNGIPNNLVPYISQVAIGKLERLSIFGNDYDTIDGTGVRDYIHVVDLANGHLKALDKVFTDNGIEIYNLGTGKGNSVLEVVKAFEKISGINIPYKIVNRRPGDIPVCFADTKKAERELGWKAERGIEKMCEDTWRWQKNNPNGY